MSKFARIAATAIAIAAAVPTGGTSLLAVGAASVGVGLSATAVAGIALASQIGAGLLASKPKGNSSGTQTDWKADPRAPVPIVFGRTGVSGYIVYRKGSGDADRNTYQTLVTVLSGAGPIDAIEASYADKQKLTFSGTAETGKFKDWIWEARQLGACPEPAALQTAIGNKPGWTAASKLSGLAAVMDTLHYDSKGKGTFMTEPAMLWVTRGVRCYDPRLDSTYPGGSGPQRIADQTTWAFSRNPYVVGITWALGWRQNGIRVAGVGMPPDTIDVAAFVEGANVADLNGWTVGGQVTTADDKWDVLKQILQAGGGEPIREGAILSCLVNAPRVSIATFTEADLAGAASLSTTQRQRDRVNGIVPSYRSEAHFWEQIPGGLVQEPAFVAQDGRERSTEVTYPLVQVENGQDASQPVQLAGYDLENAREATPIVLPGKLRWIGYRPGDCITLGIGESRLSGRDMIILRRGLSPKTGVVPLTCRTEDPTKHARVFARTGDVPPTTDFYRPTVPGNNALPGEDPLAAPTNFTAQNGTGQATITWRNPVEPTLGYTRLSRAPAFNTAPWGRTGATVSQSGVTSTLTSTGASISYAFRPKVAGGTFYVILKRGNSRWAFVGRDQGGALQPAWWDFDNGVPGSGNTGGFVTWTPLGAGMVMATVAEGTGTGNVGVGVSTADNAGTAASGLTVQIMQPWEASAKVGSDIVGGLGAVQSVTDTVSAGTYIYFVRSYANDGTAAGIAGPAAAVVT